jgi:hypothetical protein
MSYEIVPAVDAVREFLEIAGDFTNPLEVVREAISNSVDADANRIDISFTRLKESGRSVLVIEIKDDGHGMNADQLQSFFDLGNSAKRGDNSKIGEKGHGTKVFFSCSSIRVETIHEKQRLVATMDYPFERLHDGQLPVASVETGEAPDELNGTRIQIKGFNGGNGEPFTQHRLHDYILWFSKFGSWEGAINSTTHEHRVLYLKGLDAREAKEIKFGHFFPENSLPVKGFLTNMSFAPRIITVNALSSSATCADFLKFNSMLCFRSRETRSNRRTTRCFDGRVMPHLPVLTLFKIVMDSGFVKISFPSNGKTTGSAPKAANSRNSTLS